MKAALRLIFLGPLWLFLTLVFVVIWPLLFFFSWIADDGEVFSFSDFLNMSQMLAEDMGLMP